MRQTYVWMTIVAMCAACGDDATSNNTSVNNINETLNNSTTPTTPVNNSTTPSNNATTSPNNVTSPNNTTSNNMTSTTTTTTTTTMCEGDQVLNPITNTCEDRMPVACKPDFGEADACGGDAVGSWTIDEVCVDDGLVDQIGVVCPGATGTVMVNATGTLEVTATMVTRMVNGTASGTVSLPTSCQVIQFVGCAAAGTAIEMAVSGVTATCQEVGQDCECDVSFSTADNTSATYTSDNGTLSVDDGGEMRTFYYCVDSGTLSLREYSTDAQAFVLEGLFTQVYTDQ